MFGLMKWKKEQPAVQDSDVGLQCVEESRDDWMAAAKDWEAKFKKAIKDIADQADEITLLNRKLLKQAATIESLRPDAEAMRAKRQRDRDQKAAKRAVK